MDNAALSPSSCPPPQSVWSAPLYVHVARLVLIPIVVYMVFLASLMVPFVRRHMLFLHKARWPLFPKFDSPEVFGFAPNRVCNFYLHTPDGIRIGVWHAVPLSVAQKYNANEDLPKSAFEEALRVQGHRKHLARHVSSEPLDMNFVTIDYRGFGDSSNVNPSEGGLITDARTVWDWLTQEMKVPPSQIVIAGQSLGTGVACALAGRSLAPEGDLIFSHDLCLAEDSGLGITPRALILTAPFTSIRDLLLTYKAAEFIPVLQPLRYFRTIREYIFAFLDVHFDTFSVIRDIHCPILMIHCITDGSIPYEHSERLFQHLCADTSRSTGQSHTIETESIGQYARLDKLASPSKGLDVQFLEMHFGGHDNVGYSEAALQTMKSLIFNR